MLFTVASRKPNPGARLEKISIATILGVPIAGLVLTAGAALAQGSPSQPAVPGGMTGAVAESLQFYKQMHSVLSHPRCVNCHPKDDIPKQGLDAHVHSPPMTRGPHDRGPPGIDVYGEPREPVPLPKAEFHRVVVAWARTGGACPD